MLEISESGNIGIQANEVLTGKTIKKVIQFTSPHKFTWYNGDPKSYDALFTGRTIERAVSHCRINKSYYEFFTNTPARPFAGYVQSNRTVKSGEYGFLSLGESENGYALRRPMSYADEESCVIYFHCALKE